MPPRGVCVLGIWAHGDKQVPNLLWGPFVTNKDENNK